MKLTDVRQTATIAASPREIYETLLNSRRHARLTGAPARISRRVGGRFSVYGGSLSGVQLELVPDRQIVQSWRADDWPADHSSRATFRLVPIPGGTRLEFRQRGVPQPLAADIRAGWHDYYWKPLKALFRKGGRPPSR